MQFFVQDVREWGDKKILTNFAQTLRGENYFFERLSLQNLLLGDYKSTAFSLPRYYRKLYDAIKGRYYGMEYFMNNCEPLILSMDIPGKAVQRRFRNQWVTCWGSFGKSANLAPDTVSMVKELGIRICYVDGAKVPDEIFQFYNAVLKWFVYTSTEGAILETGFTPTQLIGKMIVQEPSSFVHDIQVGF